MTDLPLPAPGLAPAHTEPLAPLALFPSLEAAEAALKAQAEAAGFLASRRRSKRSRLGDFRKVWFQCVHGRPHQKKAAATSPTSEDATKKARKTTSARIGCPWQATAHRLDGVKGNEWQLTIVEPAHNHEMEADLSIYAAARKPSRDEERLVESLLAAGAAPREVIASVKQAFPQSRLINRDIYNMRKKLRGNFSDLLQALQAKYDGLLPRQKFALHERVKKLCEELDIDLEHQAIAGDVGANNAVNAGAVLLPVDAGTAAAMPRNNAELLSTITRQCGICGGIGHFLAHCPKRQRMREASASTSASASSSASASAATAATSASAGGSTTSAPLSVQLVPPNAAVVNATASAVL